MSICNRIIQLVTEMSAHGMYPTNIIVAERLFMIIYNEVCCNNLNGQYKIPIVNEFDWCIHGEKFLVSRSTHIPGITIY